MATTRPSRTVKPMTENGATLGRHDDTGGAVDERGTHVGRQPRERHRPARHGLRAADDDRRVGMGHPSVGAQDDVGVEHGHERVEVALPGRGEERVDDHPLAREVRIGRGRLALHAMPRAARELARRGRRPADDRRDLVEGHGEHVVQHERETLGGRQRLEHDEQRQPDGVGQQRLVLGIDAVRAADDRLGDADRVERILAPRAPRLQLVQADPRDDGGEPAAEVLDRVGVGAVEPQPGLLDGVVGLRCDPSIR